MSAYSLDLREKIVESVKKGVSKTETARRFGVDRATVKRFCKQLDERGTLEPRKAPGKRPKLDEKATMLLAKDLEERPWATHSQRAEFWFALSGVRVSEATVCRAVGRLRRSRKKDPKEQQNEKNSREGYGAWRFAASILGDWCSSMRWAPTPPWLLFTPTRP
jgi:transposase